MIRSACLKAFVLALCCLSSAQVAAAPDPDHLSLASVQAAVARLDAGPDEYIHRRRAERSVPIASVTKLMTALVVMRSGADLDEWLAVVERQQAPPNNAFTHLRVGSELRRRDLLRIMLQASENMAAHVLASHHESGREGFVEAMNRTATELGMTGSRFVGPSGLWPDNRSTAADLVKLARAAHGHPEIREFSTGGYFRARFRNPGYSLTYGNTNPLTHSSRWDVRLSKTGYLDEAGRCLVMVTVLDGEPLILVLLDSFGRRSPLGDAGRIRRWLATGDSGSVAGAAADHARRREAEYQAREGALEEN
jgi:D-alanyl-D-alanine endopeptidase (penicillin-binding protein 7)